MNGHREWLSVANYDRVEVGKWIELVKTGSGAGEMRYKLYQRTDHPSIQGVWTPFTHKAPEKNIASFPNVRFRMN